MDVMTTRAPEPDQVVVDVITTQPEETGVAETPRLARDPLDRGAASLGVFPAG